MQISVVIITYNEEANIGRTLASVMPLVRDSQGEIIVVDSGSTDRTVEIARQHGAQVFVETWKGFAAQKNSALEKASGEWILSLDADEEPSAELIHEIAELLAAITTIRRLCVEKVPVLDRAEVVWLQDRGMALWELDEGIFCGFRIPRRNFFLKRWIRHGGFFPDPKLRLFLRGIFRFEDRLVHEDVQTRGLATGRLRNPLIHHSYPTLSDYIEHMNRYSSLGAEMAGPRAFSLFNIVLRPLATFVYNYFFRLGFLDGREGLLLHLYHAGYVSWKYAKAWELRKSSQESGVGSQ